MNRKNNAYRLLWAAAVGALLLAVCSCQKPEETKKANVDLFAEYMGESARGLEFLLGVSGATPGTYTFSVKDAAGREVFSSPVSVLAVSSFDIAVPVEAFGGSATLTGVLESATHRGEALLHDGRGDEGLPVVSFREGESLLLEMGRPHVIAPVFYPSAVRVAGRSPQWYLTTGCAAMQVSADGLSAKVGGLKEGNVEVGLYLESGKRGLSTRVVIPEDPAFSAAMVHADNFAGQTVSISLKREKAADPDADYRVALAVDGTPVAGIAPAPAERYDLTPASFPLSEGSHMATLQVNVGEEAAYEFLLPFTVYPTPDPSFSVGGAEPTPGRLVLPHRHQATIAMTTPGFTPDGYSLDFSACPDLITARTTDGRSVTATGRGEGTFRLTVHKGDGTWTSEPIPVLSYGVIDITPQLIYDGFKASAAKGGFKVENHPYGDSMSLKTLTVENLYTVKYAGGKSVTVEGTKKSFSSVSLETGKENRWSLADDAQALLDALGRAGATQASLESLTIEQTLTFSFSEGTMTLFCAAYEDSAINTTVTTKTVCTSLDPRIPTMN